MRLCFTCATKAEQALKKGQVIMEEWMVIAILDRSAGNAEVGEMWQETKVFDNNTTLLEVLKWANNKHNCTQQIEMFRGNLKLTIAQ